MPPVPHIKINVDTASKILTEHYKLNEWRQSIKFAVGVEVIDLLDDCGDNPSHPPNVKGSTSSIPKTHNLQI